jgi:muramoyltetrapeptide carboxypeptidase LdcA involved in peptidoglycan recycling
VAGGLLVPAALRGGDTIAVTAPSSGVEPRLHPRLDLVLADWRARGWRVEEGACLREERGGASAPAAERAAELMRFLLRDDVAAIVPPWGGELAIEILDRLDWQALARARPKWLLGYSDTSTWILPMSLRLGWATAHGPCLMDLVPGQTDALTRDALGILERGPGATFVQRQSEAWQSQWSDFGAEPASPYRLTEPTRWRTLHGTDAAAFGGRLVGGCLDTLLHIARSPHGDVPGFVARSGADGAILYLENAELAPAGVARALQTLRWAGWFDGIAGLLVGRSSGPDGKGPDDLFQDAVLRRAFADAPFPVLVDVDIGHLPPQLVLVNGARAEVHWSAADGGRVVQHLD